MRLLFATAMFLILGGIGMAQTASPPQFEVASVKPAAPDQRGTFIRNMPGGRMSVTNMTLKELIQFAWRIPPFQVSGGPSWLDSARWDITAKPETTPKPDEMPLMVQALLADRFQLTVHRETKELPVYALVVRKEGKLGPGLTEAKEGACTVPDMTKPLAPPEPGKMPPLGCGGMRMSPRQLGASAAPISSLVPALSRILGRTVIDKTGLTGKFDIVLQWTPDESQAIRPQPDGTGAAPPADSNGPSIFTAIQEQLGLKLDSQKGPVEIFVIDRAEKPSGN